MNNWTNGFPGFNGFCNTFPGVTGGFGGFTSPFAGTPFCGNGPTPFGTSNWFNTWTNSTPNCSTPWGFSPNGCIGTACPDYTGAGCCMTGSNTTTAWASTPIGVVPVAGSSNCIPMNATLSNGAVIQGCCINGCFVPASTLAALCGFSSPAGYSAVPHTTNGWTGTWSNPFSNNWTGHGWSGNGMGTSTNTNWTGASPNQWNSPFVNGPFQRGPFQNCTPSFQGCTPNFGGFGFTMPGYPTSYPTATFPFAAPVWNTPWFGATAPNFGPIPFGGFVPSNVGWCPPSGFVTPNSFGQPSVCPTSPVNGSPVNGTWVAPTSNPIGSNGYPQNTVSNGAPYGQPSTSHHTVANYANAAKPFGGIPTPVNPGINNGMNSVTTGMDSACCQTLARNAA